MAQKVRKALFERFEIFRAERVLLHAAVVFERAHRRHDHDGVGAQICQTTLDVKELFRAEIGGEARLGDGIVRELLRHARGEHAVAAVGDIRKRAAVDEHGRSLERLDKVGAERIAQQRGHRALGPEIVRRNGRAVIGIPHDDAAEPRPEIRKALRETEHRHDLACHGDVEPVLARAAVRSAAEPVHNVPQLPVVHVNAALPRDLLRVDPEGVALLDVVIEQRREQVVGSADGVKIAGKMKVYVLHRDDLGIAAAGRAALDAKHRPQRRLAQRGERVFSAAAERIGKADGGRSLSLARRCRRDGRDENELSVRRGGLFAQQVERNFRLVSAVRLNVCFADARSRGDLGNIFQRALVRDLDIGHPDPSPYTNRVSIQYSRPFFKCFPRRRRGCHAFASGKKSVIMPSGDSMDTKAKNKKPSAIQPGMILSLVLCVGLGAGVAYALPENESFFAVFLFGLAGFCVSFALQTILHETGHLIGGLLTGYKFCSFRIGNLQLQRENGALRFRRLKLAGTGGQCLMTPPEPVDGKIPVMLYNLAGPLMNLLAALLALGGYFLSGGGSVGASLLFLFAFAGLYLALTNGIPLRLGPIDNDGKNAFSLRRDPEAMRAFYLQMAVNSRQTEGERLRDMPDEWFVMPSDEAMQNALVAATGVFCCSRLMDEHRFAEAHEAMSRLLSGGANLVGLYRALLLCDEMYLELLGENRRGTVDAMLTKPQRRFMRQMKDFPSVLRTEYALALLHDGDKERAALLRGRFEKIAEAYPYRGEIEQERSLLALADGKIQNKNIG